MSEGLIFVPSQPPQPSPDIAIYRSIAPVAQLENEDELDYPVLYSEAKAEQWALEDPLFCKESYKHNPYFTKELQADIRQAEAEFQADKGIRFDPRKTRDHA